MYDSAIKKIAIENSLGSYDSRNIGAEAEDIIISRDASGEIIPDLSAPGVQVATTEPLAETVKVIEYQIEHGGGGGGSTVTYTQTLQSGTESGKITIDGVQKSIYAPTPATSLSQLTNDDNYVQDASYVHTDNNYTTAEKSKLQNIAAGAEVNVQADWEEMNSASDAYINNKPTLGTAAGLDVAVSGDASATQVVKGDDTRLSDARNAADVYAWAKEATKPTYTASEVGAIPATEKGAANGVATLDSTGKIPTSQLPASIDDIIEGYLYNGHWYLDAEHTQEVPGQANKIYVDLSNDKSYRWSGSQFVEISSSLALGETAGTAYEGNKGKANADNIATIQGVIPSNATTSNKLVTQADIPDVTNCITKSSTAGLVKNDGTIDTNSYIVDNSYVHTDNNYTSTEKTKLNGIETGAEVNVQANWTEADSTSDAYILNKPELGSAALKDVPTSGDAAASEVVLGNDSRLSDSRTPLSHEHTVSDITNFPTLGTAAEKNVPASGNASSTEVVMGNDTRLTDPRTPTAHEHTTSDITNFPTLGTAAEKNVPVSGNASTTEVVMGDDTRLSDARQASDVYAWAKESTKPTYTASEVGAIPATEKGAANGVATLDSTGKIPSSQLPASVDDIINGYLYNGKWYADSEHTIEIAGQSNKIYVDLSNDKTYRWSGLAFVEISASLALGETSGTAYEGNKGKANADAIIAIKDGANIDSFGDVESALGDKQDTMQFSTMPAASATYVGKIVQYTGATTSTYTNGYFYKCLEDTGSYYWEDLPTVNVGMVILTYGSSVWEDFINAYRNNKIVYCRASSASDPSSGEKTRLAFLAYVNNEANPTEVEFQYYRSVNDHTYNQQGDEVYVYKLTLNTSTGVADWSFQRREAYTQVQVGDGISYKFQHGNYSYIRLSTPAVAPSFSDSVAYAEGDIVFYENNLYKCTTAHAAGAWDANDFTQTTVGAELAAGGSGASKHVIEDPSGTDMTERSNLQFVGNGVTVTDDSTNDRTVVTISGGSSGTVLTGTLVAGQTTLTFLDSSITTDSMFDIYTDTFNVNPIGVNLSTGSLVVQFEEQSINIGVKVRVS